MKTITLNLYEFDELSDAAKDKARDWYRRVTDDDSDWSEHVIDEAVQQGELLGIEFKTHAVKLYGGGTRDKPCIWWSGFNSQGDGACFEGTWRACDVKAGKVAEDWGEDEAATEIKRIAAAFKKEAEAYPKASFKVTHSDRYYHERSVDYEFNFNDLDDCEDWTADKSVAHHAAIEQLKDLSRDFMRWIYRQLERAYEYDRSNECVDENIRCNGYTFTEDGKRHD